MLITVPFNDEELHNEILDLFNEAVIKTNEDK
jgi:hypothetical protein